MAGAACKVVINNGLRGLIDGVEKVLLDPDIHAGRLPEPTRLDLVQRLADVDLGAYSGRALPAGGIAGILLALEKHGLVTDEVWEIFRRPA